VSGGPRLTGVARKREIWTAGREATFFVRCISFRGAVRADESVPHYSPSDDNMNQALHQLVVEISLLLLLVTVYGCGGDQTGGDSPVEDRASIQPTELHWSTELILSATFGNIVDADLDRCGRFWVADGQTQTLEIHSESGTVIDVGRRGQGPGEFQFLRSIRLAHDTAFVMDSGNQRISVFVAPCNQEPHLDRTIPLFADGDARAESHIGRVSNGDFLITTQLPMLIGEEAPTPETTLELVTNQGRWRESPVLSYPGAEALTFRVGGGGVASPMPFGSESVIRVLDSERLIAGTTSSQVLHIHDLSGEVTDSLNLPLPSREVTSGDVDHLLESMRENGSGVLMAPFPVGTIARIEAAADEGRLPRVHPAFLTFEFDDQLQWLWVQILDADDRLEYINEGPARYVNQEGVSQFVGAPLEGREFYRITTPGHRRILRARGGQLLTVVEDELGVQTLEVLSIEF
jgi:hypothetical protein